MENTKHICESCGEHIIDCICAERRERDKEIEEAQSDDL